MTELLERAIVQLKTLPTERQDAIAAIILQELEELEDDRALDEAFANSPDTLSLQLQQWLNIMRGKLKNSMPKHCAIGHYQPIP